MIRWIIIVVALVLLMACETPEERQERYTQDNIQACLRKRGTPVFDKDGSFKSCDYIGFFSGKFTFKKE